MIAYIILLIFSLFFLFIGIACLLQSKQIKIEKTAEQKEIEQRFEVLNNGYNNLNENYHLLCNKKAELELTIEKEKEKFEQLCEKEKNKISEQINLYKENTSYASQQYLSTLEESYNEAELQHDRKIQALEVEKIRYEEELNRLRESLSAGVQASLREREKEEKLEFYKLTISNVSLEDVTKLENIKLSLHQPVILSKLIWTTYFQKQTTEMCNRILGTKKICGIYKITNLKTQQCYIGQSVDVSQRWKDHVKCGLGIDAPATNKLYNAMQKDGIWNFSFELMEECDRNLLNEKEKLWIEMYQSNLYGYNATKGNG